MLADRAVSDVDGKNQFDTLPQDIEQAARLTVCASGKSCCASPCRWRNRCLWRRALFGWLLAWDEFFYALLFTSNLAAQTLPVTIAGFTAGRATDDDGLVAAVGILASVPSAADCKSGCKIAGQLASPTGGSKDNYG